MFSSNQSNVVAAANYIEDVFSTYLYSGSASTKTITNNIDLSGKGGLVWLKIRNDTLNNILFDTTRGDFELVSNSTAAQANNGRVFATSSTGFSLKGGENATNNTPNTYASWTFRKQPKMFDIQTWTGTGANRTISHALGAVPGCIIVKRTDTTADWQVYHRSNANTEYMVLNTTAAVATGATRWNSTTPTSTEFSLGTDASVNSSASGATYIAYIFAHNAGGFGLTGTDNVISCGSFTTDGSGNASVTLGYEPQWIVIKKSSDTGDWDILDTMRGWVVGGVDANLKPNTTQAESAGFDRLNPTATGFVSAAGVLSASQTFIYIALRRGPMAVPTTGTSVFSPITAAADPSNVSVGFPTDLFLANNRAGSNKYALSRLTGEPQYLTVNTTAAEQTYAGTKFDLQNNFTSAVFYGSTNTISYMFGRSPSFMDVVCFTQTTTSGAQAVSHNLTVVPELVIVKARSGTSDWEVFPIALNNRLQLNVTTAASTYAPLSSVTSTSFSYPMADLGISIGATWVAYLFATAPGVSKVGTYNGNDTTQAVPCGFTGGARFVLIRRTNASGDWYVYDTARGMTVLTDPYLRLNSTSAEIATLGSVTTTTGGFTVDNTVLAGINATGGTYIFLAVS